MGACYSCKYSLSSSTLKNNIRVVHLNGYVEDFEQSISASQVIIGNGNPPTHFLCTSIQLLSSSSKALIAGGGDTQLQHGQGQLYFKLPYSILQSDFSPVDLACIARKLTSIAKTKPSSSCDHYNKSSTTVWSSPASISRSVGVAEKIGRSSCRVQPWRPILDSITEKPISMRSESDLQQRF